MSTAKPSQPPVLDDDSEAPTAKREIPPELREEASPATPRPHTTIRLNQADIDSLLKREKRAVETVPEDRETLPAVSSSPDTLAERNDDKP